MNAFALRAAELTEDRPELAAAVTPLLNARVAIEQQIADLDRKVMKRARNNAQVQHFMTAPGKRRPFSTVPWYLIPEI